MQLSKALVLAGVVLCSAPDARADGEVQLIGKYYKERATRVVQPMLDIKMDAGMDTEIDGHFLIDSITSASVAAGAIGDAFTENRFEGGVAVSHRLGDYRIGVHGRYSYEPDYESMFGGLRASAELGQKNTTIALALGIGLDDISNAGAQGGGMGESMEVEGELTTALASLSLSQVLSPLAVATITYDIGYLDGFLENPYRQVIAQGMLEPERVPDTRRRHAILGSVRAYVPRTRSSVAAGYRVYFDDWGLVGSTPEVRLIQEIIPDLDVHLRLRHHWQSAADFYKPVYDSVDPAVEPFLTDDVKLSAFTGQIYGLGVESALSHLGAAGHLGAVRVKVSFEYVVQRNRFGNAVVGQIGVAVPFAN